MAEHVARAVDPRSLSVPDGEDAVVLAFAEKLRLLGTPARGRREFLVEAGLEDDAGARKFLLRLPELLVEPAQRRAAIARHEPGGIEVIPAVALALHQQHANDRLGAGDEDPFLAQVVLVRERYVVKRHAACPRVLAIFGRFSPEGEFFLPSGAASNEIARTGRKNADRSACGASDGNPTVAALHEGTDIR